MRDLIPMCFDCALQLRARRMRPEHVDEQHCTESAQAPPERNEGGVLGNNSEDSAHERIRALEQQLLAAREAAAAAAEQHAKELAWQAKVWKARLGDTDPGHGVGLGSVFDGGVDSAGRNCVDASPESVADKARSRGDLNVTFAVSTPASSEDLGRSRFAASAASSATSIQTDRNNLTLAGREHLSLLDGLSSANAGSETDSESNNSGFGDQTMAAREALEAQGHAADEYFDPERSI